MIDDEIVNKLKEVEVRPHNTSAGEEASKKMKEDIIDMYEKSLGNKNDERVNDPIEQGYDNACKDQNFTSKLDNENDPTAKAYKDFADEIDNGHVEKRMMKFSITREDGKLIHSSETIPLNSILTSVIGATIGNCTKDGDEFKFILNVEEDGNIDIRIHAPNNKMNNNLISKLFNDITDENKMNSEVIKFIYKFASNYNYGSKTGSSSNGCNSSDGRWKY